MRLNPGAFTDESDFSIRHFGAEQITFEVAELSQN